MKTLERKQIEAEATKKAYIYVISGNYAKQSRWSSFRSTADKRTIWGRAFNAALQQFIGQYAELGRKALDKHIERRRQRNEEINQLFCNVKDNAIWKDYQNNKCYGSTVVFADHIRDGIRNHWAKTAQDFRVLAAIMKANA